MATYLQRHPPRSPSPGSQWDCQCGRCGSTLIFEDCGCCGGDGVSGHDCGEDTCCCIAPLDNVVCSDCGGAGSFAFCVSSREHCEGNPRIGRESVARSMPEWFEVPA